MMEAIRVYRSGFRPSAQLERPYVMLGFNAFAADDDEEAALLATSVMQAFVALRDSGGDVSRLAGGADERLATAVSALAVEPLDGDATVEYAEGVWVRLQELLLKGRSDALRLRLQKLNPTSDPEYDALFGELVVIDGELRRLRHGVRDAV